MTASFQNAIVRICLADGTVKGAGFLVGKEHILTCAHVVASALGIPNTLPDIPNEPIYLDFPEFASRGLQQAHVVLWQPPRPDGGDIAGLKLESAAPSEVAAIRLLSNLTDLRGHPFNVYGFPEGIDNGVHATGRILGRQSVTQWVQIEDTKDSGRRVEQGFSGAPVWDEHLNGMVGMVVASDREAYTKTAFIIPSDVLQLAWPIITFQDEEPIKKSWKDDLNDDQQKIAIDPANNLCVLAGPGTGKTFSLIRRVAHLIENGADPHRILLVTFTRTAASDLAKELRKFSVQHVGQITTGTLHSYCFSILRQANLFLQTGRSARRILLDFEERFLLEDLKFYGSFGNFNARRRLLKLFEAAWAKEQNQQPGGLENDVYHQFDRSLKDWLRFHDAMMIEEIVPETLKYLRDNPACAERSQFDNVLIDEYQDLNKAEQSLIDLVRGDGSLTVIGDEDQSIFERFRFAHPEGITSFHNTHSDTLRITLQVCRRCPANILQMANSLIKNNINRINRSLIPHATNGQGAIHIVQWQNMDEEAQGLAQYLNTKITAGKFNPGEILILCPRREFGWVIKRVLETQYGQPVRSFFLEDELEGNPKKYEDSKAQQAFTLLLLTHNPNDKVALRCWLGFAQIDLNAEQYKNLYDYCQQSRLSPREALEALSEGRINIPKTNKLLERYKLVKEKYESFTGKSPRAVFDELFPTSEEWAEPFRTFTENLDTDKTLEEFIEAIRNGITQPELPSEVDYIRIMSLHKSKGLTADHVVVVGCVQGLIPTIEEDTDPTEYTRMLEEQRRLFYVAITRPRKTLVLSSVLNLPQKLARKWKVKIGSGNQFTINTITSDFISELGPTKPAPVAGRRWHYE